MSSFEFSNFLYYMILFLGIYAGEHSKYDFEVIDGVRHHVCSYVCRGEYFLFLVFIIYICHNNLS